MCLHHHLYKHPILRTKWWYFFSIITFLRNSKEKNTSFPETLLFCTLGRSRSDTKMKLCQIRGELETYIIDFLRGFTFPRYNWFSQRYNWFSETFRNGLWKPVLKWQNRIYPTISFYPSKKTLLMWIRKTTNFSNNIFSNNYLS